MHDAVEIERRGKPAVAVITDQFVVTARARAEVLGTPEYPMAVVPHPVCRLPEDLLRQRAEETAPIVVAQLLGK